MGYSPRGSGGESVRGVSLVLSFSCANLEFYHQSVCFVFRKPRFSSKVREHKNVFLGLQKTLLLDGKPIGAVFIAVSACV